MLDMPPAPSLPPTPSLSTPDPTSLITANIYDSDISHLAGRDVQMANLADRCIGSLAVFVQTFWSIIEPGKPLVWGWYLQAICDHLQAASTGEITHLLICMPPRHMKSSIVSVMWLAWMWTSQPWRRGMYGSYDERLTQRDADKTRSIIKSERYQKLFKPSWKITREQDSKNFFRNTMHGSRKTYYVGSRMKTGWGGDHIALDDPLSAESRYNRAIKTACNESYDDVVSTRIDDPTKPCFVVVMQRLAEDDLVGFLIDKYGSKYTQLILRTEFDPAKRCTTPIFSDPRTSPGELLNPERYPREVIEDHKHRNEIDFAAQFNQDPVPSAGNRFKVEKFQYWTHAGGAYTIRIAHRSGAIELIGLMATTQFLTVDPACSEKNEGDFTSIGRWAWVSSKGYLILLHRVSIQEKEPGVIKAIREVYSMKGFGPARPICVCIESNGPGKPIAQAMESSLPIREIPMVKHDKVARSAIAVIHIDNGLIFFPDLSVAPWMKDVSRQLAMFPGAPHDDDVDNVSLAANAIYELAIPEIRGSKSGGEQKPQHDASRNRFDAATSGVFGKGDGNGSGSANGNRRR
jgi:predicted phage terminase large subunit-like protein